MPAPAAAKVILKALSAASSSQTGRKTILYIIIGIVTIILLIVAIPVYLLSHPLEALSILFGGNKPPAPIENFKAQYDSVVALEQGEKIINGKCAMPCKGEIAKEYSADQPGMDFSVKTNDNIMAIADGTVVEITVDKTYGNTVLIKHVIIVPASTATPGPTSGAAPDATQTATQQPEPTAQKEEFYSYYTNFTTVYALPGQQVRQGDIIGLAGKNIFHFEVRNPNGTRVNLRDYLFSETQNN